jgi:hypothetical protein
MTSMIDSEPGREREPCEAGVQAVMYGRRW